MQLLSNSFQLPDDGWYQISALGEFPHNPTGLVQIVDDASCRAMADHFAGIASQPNFAGLLIDFDHFSLEKDKPSEAAGWIVGLQSRPDGLWAQIRWSDAGESAVKGGRYRFISPVWRQDECEDLGNKRVRPLKLINAAVTNDPNIRGMTPLSNRATPEIRVDSRVFAVSNRSAIHFTRGVLLAGGTYHDPRTGAYIRNYGMMSDEQRRAMFARLRGGGAGAPRTSSFQSRPSRDPVDESSHSGIPGLPVTTDYNLDHVTGQPVDGGGTPEPRDPTAVQYDPIRESQQRIAAIEQQRDALTAQRPVEPKKPDFTLTDTRKLARELMRQGKGTNEVTAAVKAAEAENVARKAALYRIKKDIAKAYPNNRAKQAQALSKYMQQLDAQYQKQHDAWQKVSDKIDAAVAKANQMIEAEKVRATEEKKLAGQKTRNAAATRNQKITDAQAREQQRQVAADKADARRKAAAAEKQPKTAAAKSADDLTTYRREMTRRQFYWDSLARGETDVAKNLYPKADVDADMNTLKELAPKSRSKSNDKAHKSALAELAKQPPASSDIIDIR